MFRLTRLLIAFALALTIPLQGLAAVTTGLCMAMHQQANMSVPAHDHGADHSHDGHDTSDPDSDDGAHCAPCVACCAAAHIAPAARLYLPEFSPAAAIAASPPGAPGFLPQKLDRPPLAL